MDHPKITLIVYASAGLGHEKAAKAIGEAYRKFHPSVEVKVQDSLALSAGFFGALYRQIYYWQIQYAPWLWAIFYYSTDHKLTYFFIRQLRRVLNGLMARPLEKYFIKENPSTILVTHFMAAEIASHLKRSGKIDAKLFVVITDYLPHAVWTACGVDRYLVALEDTKAGLIARGVLPEKIRVTGIPIEEKFLEVQDRKALEAKFGIEDRRFTVLVTSGGAGIGAMQKIVQEILKLPSPIRVLIVCGTNERLKNRLEKLSGSRGSLKTFGFVNNMQELMETADVVVGKGGGLTITESFSRTKPVIIFDPVPGQEMRNALMAEKYHAGFLVRSPKEAADRIREIAGDKACLERLKEGTRNISKPESARKIAEIAEGE